MSFLPGGGSNLGNFGGQGQPQSYYDMTPEQQAQAGAEAMMRFMTSCPGKSVFAGVTGFALGGVFGLFMASVTPISDLPFKQQMKIQFTDMGKRAYGSAKNFGFIGAVFTGTECSIESLRAKSDIWNGVSAGCLTGGGLAIKSGPQGAFFGCAAFAAFSTAMLRRAPQPRQFYTPEVHVIKHRANPRLQAQQAQQPVANANGTYSMPLASAGWANNQAAPHFNHYVPQQPQQFQQYQPPAHQPQIQHIQQQQLGYQQQQQQQQQQHQHAQVPQPYAHQPQIQSIVASPIVTPANNPQTFQSAQYVSSSNTAGYDRRNTATPGNFFGQGAQGVTLMNRILMALRSQIHSEEDWALVALMQVSFTSPEACNFKTQPTLADTLLKRVHSRCFPAEPEVVKSNLSKFTVGLERPYLTGNTVKEQQKVLEALLVIRNTSFDPENAQYLAQSEQCREILVHGITLPDARIYAEFKHMCFEIVEALSFYLKFTSSSDALFTAVVKTLTSDDRNSDRSLLIPALRSLARFLIRDEAGMAESVPIALTTQVLRYLLLEGDDELITVSLDYLYQYTARRANVEKLLSQVSATSEVTFTFVVKQLIRLLTSGMRDSSKPMDYIRRPRLAPKPVPSGPPALTQPILNELLALPEPMRATQWIRASYEHEPTGEVTQISLWKAYEAQFESYARNSSVRLLPAVDFIKNVTSAFQSSAAMVVNLPNGQKKFIIKGIVPRETAVSPSSYVLPDGTTTTNPQAAAPAPAAAAKPEKAAVPPTFGVTVALVLNNIAKAGPTSVRELIATFGEELMDASLQNEALQPYVMDLLETLSQPASHGDDDDNN